MRFFVAALILFIISFNFTSRVLARHSQVLGVAAQESTPALSISEGPGLLLPNSPFYFLDLWRDNLTLLLASFTPETKARLHLKIAAERIVEVKLMLEGKNVSPAGLDTALANITQNIEGAKVVLKSEKNKGRSVEKLASDLNQVINNQKAALKVVAKISDNRIRLKVRAVEETVKDDEAEIEDELSEDELENEIQDELKQEVADEVEEASESARKVEHLLEKLNEEASKSAAKALRRREEALHKAIQEQNKELEKQEEELKKSEEKRQEELLKAQGKTAEEVRKAAKEAQKAAEKLKESQKKIEEIRSGSSDND